MNRLLLFTLVFLLLADTASAATLYFSSSGSGTRAGTACADTNNSIRCPFSQINTLQAGDTGIIKNAPTGSPHTLTANISLICGSNANNGTQAQPITLRGESERQATLQLNGRYLLYVESCSWWVFQGLTFTSAAYTGAGANTAMVILNGAADLVFRRNLFFRTNVECYHTTGCQVSDSVFTYYGTSSGVRMLFEENELYRFHRHGITTSCDGCTYRRNYANPRDFAEAGSGYGFYPSRNSIMENNIFESPNLPTYAIASEAPAWGVGSSDNNKFLGNISLTGGIALDARGPTLNEMARDGLVENNVFNCVNGCSGYVGMKLAAAKNYTLRNNTSISAVEWLLADRDPASPGDGAASFTSVNGLSISSTNFAWFVNTSVYPTSTLNHTGVFGNGGSPASSGNITNTHSFGSNPLGACMVYVPAGPAKGTGLGGADVGANVLYQYNNGVLGTAPLWNFAITSGANRGQWLARGATVAGVNDVAGSSLFDVHQRLGFGTGGCLSPSVTVVTITSPTSGPTYQIGTATINLGGTKSP